MVKIKGKITTGYGIASGKTDDTRFSMGTIHMQAPFFKKLGLDFTNYFKGTLNVDIAPYCYQVNYPKHYFKNVKWTPNIPSENFYFFDVTADFKGETYLGLIYLPDPITKVAHLQPKTVIEIILPFIKDIRAGDKILLEIMEYNLLLNNGGDKQ